MFVELKYSKRSAITLPFLQNSKNKSFIVIKSWAVSFFDSEVKVISGKGNLYIAHIH